ncbi:MAG: hypothetical protein IIZ02_02225, partial [Desulfovibrio sp.]|nr:hypothetical protein [Desulfovibrio sp.]
SSAGEGRLFPFARHDLVEASRQPWAFPTGELSSYKKLKYFLYDVYGVDDTTRSFIIHNITTLFNELARFNSNFSEKHQDHRTISVAVPN